MSGCPAEPATGSGARPAVPDLRILRGEPQSDELAALVVVLGLLARRDASPPVLPPPRRPWREGRARYVHPVLHASRWFRPAYRFAVARDRC